MSGVAVPPWRSAHALDVQVEPGPEVTPVGPLPVLLPVPLTLGGIEKSANLAVTLPEVLALPDLTAATSNGNVHAAGFRVGPSSLSTSNGDVDFQGAAGDVDASTSNGNVALDIIPLRSGRVTASNGNADVRAPEGPRVGYDAEASTSNGNADIQLTDGRASTDEDGTHAEVQTSGFGDREVRVTVQGSTSNGNASVGPS